MSFNSRHIYWWPIPCHTSGASQNNTYRWTDGAGGYYTCTCTNTAATWDSIYALVKDLQAAMRAAYPATYGSVSITVTMDTGLVRVNNIGASNFLPAPSTDSQTNMDILLGGTGTTPSTTPTDIYDFTLVHQAGVYITNSLVRDTGDLPTTVGQFAITLSGSHRSRTWASYNTRELEYQLLTELQYEALKTLFSDYRGNVILIDSPDALFLDHQENYIITDPETMPYERFAPGLARYGLAWTLGSK